MYVAPARRHREPFSIPGARGVWEGKYLDAPVVEGYDNLRRRRMPKCRERTRRRSDGGEEKTARGIYGGGEGRTRNKTLFIITCRDGVIRERVAYCDRSTDGSKMWNLWRGYEWGGENCKIIFKWGNLYYIRWYEKGARACGGKDVSEVLREYKRLLMA